jgi:hypothetical protein
VSRRPSNLPSSTPPPRPTADSPPAPPVRSPAVGPVPPPPPAPPGSDDESRATAATWVAAAGALLLLAAAVTFLAVSWETLGLTARIAVVGTVTAVAILGGHRLRGTLPAVGAVVFHLGALLLPIDALGLALQLDLELPVRWLLAGAVATTVFPPLARAGRSRILAWAAVAGVPVLATGVGLAGLLPAPIVVAAAALLPALVAGGAVPVPTSPRTLQGILPAAGPVLVATAIAVPLAVAALALDGLTPGGQLASAGWLAASWVPAAIAGVLAVAALVVAATRQRSPQLASLFPVAALGALVVTLLPPATPRLALLLAPALVALASEVLAAGVRVDGGLWWAPTHTMARVVEAGGGLLAPGLLALVIVSDARPSAGDAELAAALAVGALAAAVAVVRRSRRWSGRPVSWARPALVGLAGLLAAGASAVLWGRSASLPVDADLIVAAVLLLAGVVTLVDAPWAGDVDVARAGVALGTATGLALVATTSLLGQPSIQAVATATALLLAVHLRAVARDGGRWRAELTAVALPVAITLVLVGWLVEPRGGAALSGDPALTATIAVVTLLVLGRMIVELPLAAGSAVVAAVVPGLFGGPSIGWWQVAEVAPSVGQEAALLALGGGPTALVPAGVALVGVAWIGALAGGRTVVALTGVLGVRVLVVAALALGASLTTTGSVVVGVAVAAALAGVFGPSALRPGATASAAVGGPVGWLLIGDDPWLRAGVTIAVGATVAVVGWRRRRALVAHAGGALVTLGVWQLLTLGEVTALDLWLLPVAVQLWVAGVLVRRRSGTSSWIADVPPLLLAAIPALAERIAGGPGWHAVLAGALASVAVVHGGAARLGGPLFVGTFLLVASVLIEVIAVVAAVPTWMWLALGGTALLAAASAIERSGGTPATVARRLREVVGERFA